MTKIIINGLMGRMGQEIAAAAYNNHYRFSPTLRGGEKERSDEEGGEL